nr:ribonuclease P protein component [Desulforhopalus singaporensis]
MHAAPRGGKDFQRNLADQRLLKTDLIRKRWEFDRVYSRGKRFHGERFSLICLPNSTAESRIGISVHRKIRGAVKRNRIKRIIRESFRIERNRYPAGMDIVFAVRPGFSLNSPGEIRTAVREITTSFTGCH